MTLPRTIGGSRANEEIGIEHKVGGRWPSVIYKPAQITIEESKSLDIDGVTTWRHPDDVYCFDGSNYVFDRRVDYKP